MAPRWHVSHTPQAVVSSLSPPSARQTIPFVWPRWAQTARIAGAYFHPSESDATLDARLDALAAQQVSVIVADSPWGEQYATWVDDSAFAESETLIAKVVEKAHARGLKVVLYQVGLELTSPAERNPGTEHPAWAQQSLAGTPVLYNDVSKEDEHWLELGVWDFWLTPCAQPGDDSFRALAFDRVRAMVATGIDGLWVDQVYLQSSVGDHHELWPSSDPCSAAAFQAATGYAVPVGEDWDDPAFRQWVVWRHTQIAEFLLAEKEVARALNPALVFFNENSSVDTGRSTYVGNDPTAYLTQPDMSTGHEIETIADRIDEGETGMQAATLDQWLAFRTMVAFARAADSGKPSWILTYGYQPRDSAQLAGFVLAEGANFYETIGPQMADTVGEAFRTQLFTWIAQAESAFYASESLAEVGLLYSPRTRDLLDTVSGEPYDPQDSVHFASYRAAANQLYQAHVPFDVVIDTNPAAFARYRVLIVPEVQAMSDATLATLDAFTGTVISMGESGYYDEWTNFRATDVLLGANRLRFPTLPSDLAALADTQLFRTNAPATTQLALRQTADGYALIVVNTAITPTVAMTVELDLRAATVLTIAELSALGNSPFRLPFTQSADQRKVQLDLPAGIDTVAVVTLRGPSTPTQSGLPTVTPVLTPVATDVEVGPTVPSDTPSHTPIAILTVGMTPEPPPSTTLVSTPIAATVTKSSWLPIIRQ